MTDTTLSALPRKKKIAILGGGLGGLAAAYELTNDPSWFEHYEVTVFQKGWRLGGKGASGRAGVHDRIEEHGLHCFWGFYDNAFGMLRTCYGEIDRQTGPIRTVDDAFKKLSSVYFIDRLGKTWCRYEMHFPENSQRPGEGPRVTEMSVRELLAQHVHQLRDALAADETGVRAAFESAAGGDLDRKLTWLANLWKSGLAVTQGATRSRSDAQDLLEKLKSAEAPATPEAQDKASLLDPETVYRWKVLFEAAQFAFFMVAGILADGIPASLEGFDDETYDGRDLRQWLKDHGAGPNLLDSQVVSGLYNASFCYPGGDFAHGDLAAGVSLRTVLLMGFTYKGAFMWKMEASMGDIVFAPLYEALACRGVRFEFFHKVAKLCLPHEGADAGKPIIDAIHIDVQAVPQGDCYEPLFDVGGLPCWPAKPFYDRLKNGGALEPYDLESDWNSLPPVATRVLKRGDAGPDGFDEVVLAIPVGGLRPICQELMAASPQWQSMIDGIKTIRTKSFQVWLNANAKQKAWQTQYRIMTDVYENDFNSVADMSQTLRYETWSNDDRPGSVIYFSTAMADDPGEPPIPNDAYPPTQDALVEAEAHEWLSKWQEGIFGWLGATYDPSAYGEHYFRANISADQRYTLSVAGSAKVRLPPDASGFENLFVAGDWTKSPLNLGCAEGATMSGLIAGRGVLRSVAAPAPAPPTKAMKTTMAAAPTAAAGAPFVDYPGMPVYPPVYHQEDLTLCQFLLDANPTTMQAALDRYINVAAGGDRFTALGKWVLFQTGHIARNTSDGIGALYGTGQETSATFLVPAIRWRGLVPIDVGMVAPFIFVDQPLSLIAGREVLGMAKSLATFVPSGGPMDLDAMTTWTMVVDRLDSTSPVELQPLIHVRRPHTTKTKRRTLARPRATFSTVTTAAVDALVGSISGDERVAVRGLFQRLLASSQMPFFSLRQLRDLTDPTRATFQEVTRGVMHLENVDLRMMAKGHTIEIVKHASHPIAECLGLAGNLLTPVAALRIKIDRATLAAEP